MQTELTYQEPTVDNFCMRGTVNTEQKCPVCKGKFEFYYRSPSDYGLRCSEHLFSKPTRFYIQAKSFGIKKKLYSSPQGEVFDNYIKTERQLTNMRSAWDESKKENGKKFNSDDWILQEAKKKKFGNICDQWLKVQKESLKIRDIGQGHYKSSRQHIDDYLKPEFHDKDIREISQDNIEKLYVKLLESDKAKKTVKNILGTLRAILSRHRKADMPEFPKKWRKVIPKREKQWLDLGRQILVHEYIPERHGYRLAISLLQETGMRENEVIALQVQDIIDGCIKVWKAIADGEVKYSRKNGGTVTYRLSKELYQKLIDHIRDRGPDDFIFNIKGKPYHNGRLYKVWKQACKDAKVKYIPLNQSARHSMASQERQKAEVEALRRIQEKLGHFNKQTGKQHYILDESLKVR